MSTLTATTIAAESASPQSLHKMVRLAEDDEPSWASRAIGRFEHASPKSNGLPVLPSGCIGGLEAPTNPDHNWWWQRTAPLLATLLRSAGSYTYEQQLNHMRVYRDAVVPTYGPPTPQASARPLLTMDGSPFEPSWNFQNDGTVVRYTFEPLLPNDDPENPFPGDKIATLLPLLRYVAPGADTRWFEQVWSRWFVHEKNEVATAKAALPPHKTRVPQIFVAFDMKGAERIMKVYLFPVLKHLATGISTEELTWNTIRNLEPGGQGFSKVVDKLSKFLSEYIERIPVEMIAIDCVDPSKARIKIYARTKSNSKNTIRDVCTLGGLQMDESTMRGVDNLSKIWHLLLDEPNGVAVGQNKPPRFPNDHHLGVCFVFEMRPGQERIEVKCHLPWAQTNSNDIRTTANFTEALELLGYERHAGKYARGALATAMM